MEGVTERSLYPHIIKELRDAAEALGVKISCEQEVGVAGRESGRLYPDLLCGFDGERVLIQVKIGKSRNLLEDLVRTYPVAKRLGAGLILLLYPEQVRSIPAGELEKVFPKIKLPEAHIASDFLATSFYNLTTRDIGSELLSSYKSFLAKRIPSISYSTIAVICRDAVVELSTAIRKIQRTREYIDMSQAIVGRFDFYRSMLSDMTENEEVMMTYLADIAAYLSVIHLLLVHILSTKVTGQSLLPAIDNPLSAPRNYLKMLFERLSSSSLIGKYPVLETGRSIFNFLSRMAEKEAGINEAVVRLSYALQALRPEHVREELFGRIYQESLPPEARKNLGAFFTRPEAASLLASLAIREWDDRVLDPACGSGTLLAEAYKVKWSKAMERFPGMDPNELHELFLREHIMGIDIMHFAKELSTVNLILQRPEVPAKPMIFHGDGISKTYVSALDDPPEMATKSLTELLEKDRGEYERLDLRGKRFDVVIMNPPFTRRENIPESERPALEKMMGRIVRGKTGYWAYFFVASDQVIKIGGRLAAVTPEEFFAGAAAESVRRYLFLREIYNPQKKAYERLQGLLDRLELRFVVRSAAEVSFSEQAQYRDYLVILEKTSDADQSAPAVYAILKKPLDALGEDRLKTISEQLLKFAYGGSDSISNEYFDAMKIDVGPLIKRHIGNLKPLVAMGSPKAQKMVIELLQRLSGLPTLGEISKGIKAYNPGQYTTKGVEDYARKLFAARYESKGKRAFEIVRESDDVITLRIAVRARGRKRGYITFQIDKRSCVPSLRSPAGVKRLDLTDAEEFAIVRPHDIPESVRLEAKLIDPEMLSRAAEDIEKAYEDISSHILLARRLQITSPNVYWLAFFDERPVLNTAVLLNLKIDMEKEWMKALTIYLNSSMTLLQLLAFSVETRGSWVDLHGDQVWSNLHVPDYSRAPADLRLAALKLFDEIGRREDAVKPLIERIRSRDELQRKIDIIALEMIGLGDLFPKLDEIYEILEQELTIMHEILERSQQSKVRGGKGKRQKSGEKQSSLNRYF